MVPQPQSHWPLPRAPALALLHDPRHWKPFGDCRFRTAIAVFLHRGIGIGIAGRAVDDESRLLRLFAAQSRDVVCAH